MCEAGEALAKTPTDEMQKIKFRIVAATVPQLQKEFETQIAVIIKQLGKLD